MLAAPDDGDNPPDALSAGVSQAAPAGAAQQPSGLPPRPGETAHPRGVIEQLAVRKLLATGLIHKVRARDILGLTDAPLDNLHGGTGRAGGEKARNVGRAAARTGAASEAPAAESEDGIAAREAGQARARARAGRACRRARPRRGTSPSGAREVPSRLNGAGASARGRTPVPAGGILRTGTRRSRSRPACRACTRASGPARCTRTCRRRCPRCCPRPGGGAWRRARTPVHCPIGHATGTPSGLPDMCRGRL
jgi:hypothetical protein